MLSAAQREAVSDFLVAAAAAIEEYETPHQFARRTEDEKSWGERL